MHRLMTKQEYIEAGYPFGRYVEGVPKGDPQQEWRRSNPDIVVYRPKTDGDWDGDNEHFLVFRAPKSDELLALWTQSSCEGKGDNHLVLARSSDAVNWSEPEFLVGTRKGTNEPQASWGFPVVSAKGRIYVFYTKEEPLYDISRQCSGSLGCIYSDDNGYSWVDGGSLYMPRVKYDHPDPGVPRNWIVWQIPIRDSKGRYLAGYTLNTSLVHLDRGLQWWQWENRCYFMRFDNIDDNPDPKDIKITWLPESEDGVAIDNPNVPGLSFASEPSCVLLPDGRLFITMRTMTGYIWYAISGDDGVSWTEPRILRYKDDGEKVKHPLSPCPIYKLADGRYILLFHNNDGNMGRFSQFKEKWNFNQLNCLRNPTFIAVGEYRGEAQQPIWFSSPYQLLDTDGIAVGPKGTAEIGTYTSLTYWRERHILWYPDRKYYLLGKYIDEAIEEASKQG